MSGKENSRVTRLPTTLGLAAAISLVIGSIIGSGIFMKPATMAAQLGSPELLIAVWIGAGIITLFGALSNAEVVTMVPETGGQYVFYKHMYGDFFAFLFGWSAFAVFNTAGTASIAYVLSTYIEYFIELPRLAVGQERLIDLYIPFIGHIYPFENIGVKGVTMLVLIGLTYLNYRSTSFGGKVLVVFTFLKVAAIGMLIMAIFFSPNGSVSHFFSEASSASIHGWALIGAVVAALSGAFWAYDGWNNISFVSGEIKNPQVNIPRSLVIGIFVCIVIYVIINLAYLYVLPIDAIAASPMVASDAGRLAFGTIGGGLIALMVILSTLGSTQGNVLSVARVTFAMAGQKHFFASMGKVHPRFQTPGNALWIHGIWSSMLVLSGTFDTLTDMVIFSSWFFYGMMALGVIVLRKKWPDHDRPYRVWGYPYIPMIYVIFTFFFLALTLANDIANYAAGKTVIINSLLAIMITALGIPLYFYFRRK